MNYQQLYQKLPLGAKTRVAEIMGVSPNYVYKLVSGEYVPKRDYIRDAVYKRLGRSIIEAGKEVFEELPDEFKV